MSEQKRVVVIGDALIDELRDGSESRSFVGGAALNVAVGLAVLGIRTSLIAMVGDDDDTLEIREYLDRYDVALVPTIGPHGTSRAISDRTNGEPRYIFNEAAQARSIDFGAAARSAIAQAPLVIVSCFPLDNQQQYDELKSAIQDPQHRLVLDPNPRAGMMSDRERFVHNFEDLAAVSLLTKVGDEDAELLYGTPLDVLRDRILAAGAHAVLATAGAAGAELLTADGVRLSTPIVDLPAPIVDTMGAGDATLAAFGAAIARHGVPANEDAWRRVLHSSMVVAAATCRHEGALLRIPDADTGSEA